MESRLDLDMLAAFVAAAELGSFRAAAQAEFITAAALGKRIQTLEAQLGGALFARTSRQITLTPQGAALLPRARRLLHEAQECLREGAQGVAHELTLGTRHELGMSWLLPMRHALAAAQPQVLLHYYFGAVADLERRLLEHRLDAIVTSHEPATARLEGILLHREDYTFVAAPALLAQRALSCGEDALGHALIDIDEGLPLFGYCQFDARRHPPLRFMQRRYMGTIEAVRALVLAGEGVAVLPSYFVAEQLAAGQLVRVLPELPLGHDHFRLWHREGSPHRAAFEAMAGVMREAHLNLEFRV
jgi:LysR family transcriptional regulator, glycine cleavage system transcriptional activator